MSSITASFKVNPKAVGQEFPTFDDASLEPRSSKPDSGIVREGIVNIVSAKYRGVELVQIVGSRSEVRGSSSSGSLPGWTSDVQCINKSGRYFSFSSTGD